MIPETTVNIQFRSKEGDPYKGALVKVRLDKAFNYNGIYVSNHEIRQFSTSYGSVSLELVPSTLDPSNDNYYHLEIIQDTVTYRRIIVPESDTPLTLADLEDYLFPYERPDFIGDECH